MSKKSAGILLHREKEGVTELFLVHTGGPFFKNKDLGSWSIPKGEFEDEQPLDAAIREFEEETGLRLEGPFIPLTPVKQKSGKLVYAWASMQDIDETKLVCNLFSVEWPPRSGKFQEFPEVDRGEWFPVATAKAKILAAQAPLIDQLSELLNNKR